MDMGPLQVTLRDRVTIATIVPFSSRHQVPASLLGYLGDQLNTEIEKGDTYPMIDTMTHDKFASYWFQNFGAVMLLGNIEHASDVVEGRNWATECLGSFYIKPNYPGRSSHVCNAGFLVTDAARNRGVGRLMGETYIEWAPKLGYTYSVFNLVYETNVASCRIWDALGFKRIGRVKGCGNLKSYPDQLIDAIIYGRDLGPEGEDFVSEERFDKIKFYLKTGKYPNGADRAEKSRLRSAATHYKLLENDKLMLKDKEVISDPQRQYEIARQTHALQHGGINKTTATIAESFHWVRIKETVSLVIRNCTECKELGKTLPLRADSMTSRRQGPLQGRLLSLSDQQSSQNPHSSSVPDAYADPFGDTSTQLDSPASLDHALQPSVHSQTRSQHSPLRHQHHSPPMAQMQHHLPSDNDYMPLDPQIMEDVRTHLGGYNSHIQSQVHAHTVNPSINIDKYSSNPYGSPHHHQHQNQSLHHADQSLLHSNNFLHLDPHTHEEHPHLSSHSHSHQHLSDHHHTSHLVADNDQDHHSSVQDHVIENDDGDLDMLIQQDDDEPTIEDGSNVIVDVNANINDDQVKARAQAAARAAEAAMRGEEGDGDVGWLGGGGGFRDG